MYFPTTCPNCQQENRAEFADSGIHDLRCSRCGARYCVFLRKQKFEVLFDLGTRALLDGYAREAVASFSAALERFLEFYVRAFALERSADAAQDFEDAAQTFEATWRHVVSQSERQVGMLALAYVLREGREPDFLTAKALGTDFRNKVVHRGYLPRQEEVEAYAAQVFTLIDRLLTELGEAATHAELLQERDFARHMDTLPDSVTVLFEEHPGMFRARRFSQSAPPRAPADLPQLKTTATKPNKVLENVQNYQKAMFQQALEERGELLNKFKGR